MARREGGAWPSKRSQTTDEYPQRRRRPEWNSYLTDDRQYRLTQEEQLEKHLKQVSTAHFVARSPLYAKMQQSKPKRSKTSGKVSTSSRTTSHQQHPGNRTRDRAGIHEERDQEGRKGHSSNQKTQTNAQALSRQASPGHGINKENLRGELEHLERMLSELETTEYASEDESESDTSTEEYVESSEDGGWRYERLAAICERSVASNMEMKKRVEVLEERVESKERTMQAQEERIAVLEKEVENKDSRYKEMEDKYEHAMGQLDEMREAIIAAEEAIHYLIQRRHKAKKKESYNTLRADEDDGVSSGDFHSRVYDEWLETNENHVQNGRS